MRIGTILIIFVLILVTCGCGEKKQEKVEYMTGAGMRPMAGSSESAVLVVSALMPSSQGGAAIINDKIVKRGGTIEGYTVKKVTGDYVELDKDGSSVKLSTKSQSQDQLRSEVMWRTNGLIPPTSTFVSCDDENSSVLIVERTNVLWAPVQHGDYPGRIRLKYRDKDVILNYSSLKKAESDANKLFGFLQDVTKWQQQESQEIAKRRQDRIDEAAKAVDDSYNREVARAQRFNAKQVAEIERKKVSTSRSGRTYTKTRTHTYTDSRGREKTSKTKTTYVYE